MCKLEGHIKDLKDVLARISFAVTLKVASAQLSRLTGLEKTIRNITTPRLTYGRVVNNLPAPINDDPNVGVPSRRMRVGTGIPELMIGQQTNQNHSTTDKRQT
jgi:hypothetical protein